MSANSTDGPYKAAELPGGQTDWERVDTTTEEEIEAQAREDEDNPLWTAEEFASAELVTPADLDAEQEAVKAELALAIAEAIQEAGLTQTAAAERSGLTQPDVSLIVRGSIARFSVERLVRVLTGLGRTVEITIRPATDGRRGHFRVTAA